MDLRKDILEKYLGKQVKIGNYTINDIREKYFANESLSADELKALDTFDKYRIKVLNDQTTDENYHNKYRQLQVMANLSDYREFLKDIYNV